MLRAAPIEHKICPVCFSPAMDGMTHPRCKSRYSLDGMTCFFQYRGIIRNAIKSIKYRFISDLAQEFINLIPVSKIQLTTHNPQLTTLIPIPLHPSRLAFRGFNQAEVLGGQFARRLNIPMQSNVLIRVKKTIPQVEMKDKKKRLENMKDVFGINAKFPSANCQLPILLFDDVCTTGATLRSAGSTLKHSGASFVWGVVLAHG